METSLFTWVILPLLIFLARVMDVSVGTLRLIFVSKGFKFYAPLLGFFEVIIWLLAIGQIMQHLDNVMCYIAYGLGFAAGNYVGIILDEKMSIGTVLIRVVPKMDTSELIRHLGERNYGVTAVDVEGLTGKTKMILSIIKRKDIHEFVELIHRFNPHAFYTIEDIKAVQEGYFRSKRKYHSFHNHHFLRRKGK